jgi:hypothetical protein
MSKVITPTVGRKVWYRPSFFDMNGLGAMQTACDQTDTQKRQPLDATIIAVWGDRCVNLLVTDSCGKQFPMTSRTLLQPGDAVPTNHEGEPTGGYCEWMPYQQTQAAA